MSDAQTPLYHVQFRSKQGTYCGLHFVNGVSREVVEGAKDPMLKKIRAIFGSASFSLIPAEQGAVEPPPPLPHPTAAIPEWGKPTDHAATTRKAAEVVAVKAAPAPVAPVSPDPVPAPPPPPPAVEAPTEEVPKAKPWAERMKAAKAAKAKVGEAK
jgi:hypothetical protein